MTDLDRPNPAEQAYEEWCHWMVSDIPIESRCTIEGGSSVLDPKASNIGKTVLEYIPPHPAHSNPSKMHRYVFTLLKQSAPLDLNFLNVDMSGKTDMKVNDKDQMDIKNSDNFYLSKRANFLPLRKFMKDNSLEWEGLGIMTSVWNALTPDIFKSLGILTINYRYSLK